LTDVSHEFCDRPKCVGAESLIVEIGVGSFDRSSRITTASL